MTGEGAGEAEGGAAIRNRIAHAPTASGFTVTFPAPLNGPWEVTVNDRVFVNGLPSRDAARRIAASWNRGQRKGQPRFRVRRSQP